MMHGGRCDGRDGGTGADVPGPPPALIIGFVACGMLLGAFLSPGRAQLAAAESAEPALKQPVPRLAAPSQSPDPARVVS